MTWVDGRKPTRDELHDRTGLADTNVIEGDGMTEQELRQILKMLVSRVDDLGHVVGAMEERGLSEEQRQAPDVKGALESIEVNLEDTLKRTVAGW